MQFSCEFGMHVLVNDITSFISDSNCAKTGGKITTNSSTRRRHGLQKQQTKNNAKINYNEEPTYVRTVRLVTDKPIRDKIRYDTFRKEAYDAAFREMRPVYTYEKRYRKKPKSNDVIWELLFGNQNGLKLVLYFYCRFFTNILRNMLNGI